MTSITDVIEPTAENLKDACEALIAQAKRVSKRGSSCNGGGEL